MHVQKPVGLLLGTLQVGAVHVDRRSSVAVMSQASPDN